MYNKLQCVAVCCTALHCVVVAAITLSSSKASTARPVAACYSELQCVAVRCSALQCFTVRCIVSQWLLWACHQRSVLTGKAPIYMQSPY